MTYSRYLLLSVDLELPDYFPLFILAAVNEARIEYFANASSFTFGSLRVQ